jgi:hypothetical protein
MPCRSIASVETFPCIIAFAKWVCSSYRSTVTFRAEGKDCPRSSKSIRSSSVFFQTVPPLSPGQPHCNPLPFLFSKNEPAAGRDQRSSPPCNPSHSSSWPGPRLSPFSHLPATDHSLTRKHSSAPRSPCLVSCPHPAGTTC